MNVTFKRFLSASLAVVIFVSTAMTNVYASTPSQGGGGASPAPPSGNHGSGTNSTPTGDHGGVRITVTSMAQVAEAGVPEISLGDNYTAAVNQYNTLGDVLTKKVWRPGDFGLKVIKLGKVNSLS